YDLSSERERLAKAIREFEPKASVVIDSGRGFWGFWILSEPLAVNRTLARAERAKAYNAEIANTLKSDTVANIDRIARLPGTVNHKLGTLATVIEFNDATYNATDVANPPKD